MIDALGIVNFEDSTADIEGLGNYRPVPAISFLGRYRIIDFVLSNMTNSGLSQIQVHIKEKPRSLIEHLGTGLHYNINSKRGKLRLLYGESKVMSDVYNHDIGSFLQNMQYIEESNLPYVIIAPSYMIYSIDFNEVLESHIASKNDITVLYKNVDTAKHEFIGCDTLSMDKEKRVNGIEENRGKYKTRAISLETYVMSRRLFIELINRAANTSALYWFKDILKEVYDELKMVGYPVRGYVACINSLPAYYKASMELRCPDLASELFVDYWPIHTMTNDSPPTRYSIDATVKGSIVSNGCLIEGRVENCVIGRNATIKKGAVIKNCIILPGAFIGEGAKLDTVIVDKSAIVHHVKKLVGTPEAPIYVKRRDRI
ncbi:MAG: glucose-1-phosphate adenylyltransferase subunit GlgD [Anaerorhabdus sp.]|uniref:glucose-1-phosphate adenylyltransferase subunit GlgD n=1 Tax=Anaerorhabdus sp. TaxID=1872524 RepID=UPI002FC80A95